MIKEIEVCECDVCGRLMKPDIVHIDGNSCNDRKFLPTGWIKIGGDTGMLLCNVCHKAFKELLEKYHKEEEIV